MAALIQISRVSRRYVRGIDEIRALEDVSLEIEAGHRKLVLWGVTWSGGR